MDPLALLPYALAAAGGRVGAFDVTALIAAGVTLLQRSAALVRALSGRRSAVLLPAGPAWLVALAASDGRGLVVLDADTALAATELDALGIGAVFTLRAFRDRVPDGMAVVLLDDAPRCATVCIADREQEIDLGSHFALDLVGDTNGPGAPEECVRFFPAGPTLSHADVISAARRCLEQAPFTPVDRTLTAVPLRSPDSLVAGLVAPLLVGGIVRFTDATEAAQLTQRVRETEATMLVVPARAELPFAAEQTDSNEDAPIRIKHVVRVNDA